MSVETTEQHLGASLYEDLLLVAPKPVANFRPTNADEQKEAFFAGKIRNPLHRRDKLAALDFPDRQREIAHIGSQIIEDPSLNPKYIAAYEKFVENYHRITEFMELAQQYNEADDPKTKQQIGEKYMMLNIDMYGAPDEMVYRSLLQEKLHTIAGKDLSNEAGILRRELFEMTEYDASMEILERFRPSAETMAWMHEIAKELYGGMVRHMPEQGEFTPVELRDLFEKIIVEEFGEAAAGWRVIHDTVAGIVVRSTEKTVVIPINLPPQSHEMTKKLIVHEIGIHVLRSIMGSETDLEPFAHGLVDYSDSEEGLGMVMQQAITNTFEEAGVGHYITDGAVYYDGKDFRDVYEMKWRLATLESMKDGQDIDDSAVKKKQRRAYRDTLRCFQGTNTLPWFANLSYYNGTTNMWQHLESIRDDDIKFTFVLLGKGDPSIIEHENIMLETSSR